MRRGAASAAASTDTRKWRRYVAGMHPPRCRFSRRKPTAIRSYSRLVCARFAADTLQTMSFYFLNKSQIMFRFRNCGRRAYIVTLKKSRLRVFLGYKFILFIYLIMKQAENIFVIPILLATIYLK